MDLTWSRDEDAFRVLYRTVQPGLLRYLRVLVGDDAEDVASEAWLQIARLGSTSAVRGFWRVQTAGARRTAEFLYGVYAVTVFGLWIVPAWTIVKFISERERAARFTSSALKLLLKLVACPVRVVGSEYLEGGGPKIYVSNHAS